LAVSRPRGHVDQGAQIEGAETAAERIPYRYLLTCPSILAVCCAGFASYWGLALGLTWFTAYLVDGLGFSQTMGGNLFILPWIFGMIVVLGGGWLSQRLKKAGVSSRVCRGAFAAATVALGGCVLPFIAVVSDPGQIALLVVGTAVGSTIFVVIPMIVSELTPQPQRAAMLAIATSTVTFAGVIAPFAMGRVVQYAATRQVGYEQGFVILGALLLVGGIIGLLFIRPETDRKRLAVRAAAAPLQPARA
jgi:sugar phosphate permease